MQTQLIQVGSGRTVNNGRSVVIGVQDDKGVGRIVYAGLPNLDPRQLVTLHWVLDNNAGDVVTLEQESGGYLWNIDDSITQYLKDKVLICAYLRITVGDTVRWSSCPFWLRGCGLPDVDTIVGPPTVSAIDQMLQAIQAHQVDMAEQEQRIGDMVADGGRQLSAVTGLANQVAEDAQAAESALDKLTNLNATAKTLSPGSDATVTKTTTPDGYALAFGIPRGDKGEQGPKGDTGATGPQGPKGDTYDDSEVRADISELKEDIDAIYSSVSEKINVDITIKNGYVNNENGEIVEHLSYCYAEISVKADERYVISAYYYAPSKLSLVYFYDAKNVLLGSVGAYADGIEESEYVQEYMVNIPADCAKMIVQGWNSKPILVDKLELTDTDNTELLGNGYVPMHFTISNGIWSDGTIVPHASYKAIVFACGGNEHYSIDTYMNGDAKMPVARFLNRAGIEIGSTDIITDTGPLYQYKIVTPENCTKMIVNGYLQPSDWPYAIRKYIPGHLPLAEKMLCS